MLAVKNIITASFLLMFLLWPLEGNIRPAEENLAGASLSDKATMRLTNRKQINKHLNIENQSLDSHLSGFKLIRKSPISVCSGNSHSIFREPMQLPSPLTPASTFTHPKCIMWPLSIQVNGLNMQGATHHEAVSALRNAGSCIQMTVLRDRLLPREVSDLGGPQDQQDATGRQLCSQDGEGQSDKQPMMMESAGDFSSKKTEEVVCNGNSIVGGLLQSHSTKRNF